MIASFAAVILSVADPESQSLGEAAHAIEANRLIQARRMIGDAIAAGERGAKIDQLLADLAFADQEWAEAQARYAQLLQADPNNVRNAESAGMAALMADDTDSARFFVEKAISLGKHSWRTWNTLGVLCDLQRDWDGADAAYASAEELSPGRPEVLNNHGWSLLLRGDWGPAAEILAKASKADPSSKRIANNLELATTALAADLPQRRPEESDSAFAARLNDAGVAAEKLEQRERAIAAFSRALTVSQSWHTRAANNLARLQQQ